MKKLTTSQALITGFLGASLLAAIAASTYTVTVDSTGVIKYPLNFAAANGFGAGGTTNLPASQVITNASLIGSTRVRDGLGNPGWLISNNGQSLLRFSTDSVGIVASITANGVFQSQTGANQGGFRFDQSTLDTNGNASFNGSLAGATLNIASSALTVDASGNVGAVGSGSFATGINQSAPINLSDSIPLNLGTGGSSITADSSGNTTITSGGDLIIFGGTTFNNGVTFLDTITGSGAGLTGIPSTAITGGFTTNLVIKNGIISTNTLYFTNGILMKVTSP